MQIFEEIISKEKMEVFDIQEKKNLEEKIQSQKDKILQKEKEYFKNYYKQRKTQNPQFYGVFN